MTVGLYMDLFKFIERARKREGVSRFAFLVAALEYFLEYLKKQKLEELLEEVRLFKWYEEDQKRARWSFYLSEKEEKEFDKIIEEILKKLEKHNIYVSESTLLKFSLYLYAKDEYGYGDIGKKVREIYERLEGAYKKAASKFVGRKYKRSLEEDIERIEGESEANIGAFIIFLYNQEEIKKALGEVLPKKSGLSEFFDKIVTLLNLLNYLQTSHNFNIMYFRACCSEARRKGLAKGDKFTKEGESFIRKFLLRE